MIDMNTLIAENVRKEMNKHSKSNYDLSVATGLSLKEFRERMDGTKAFSARELREVAGLLGTTTQDLSKLPKNYKALDSVSQLHKQCTTENQHKTVDIADKLSDMILFHKKVRENGEKMMNAVDMIQQNNQLR